MNYVRKRALLACDFCRYRKRKCDGARPKCSTCVESNADCVYKELPFDRFEPTSPGAVVDRLSRIEALLEEQGQRINDLASSSSKQPSQSPLGPSGTSPGSFPATPSGIAPPLSGDNIDPDFDQAQFLIPLEHFTSANSLLTLPTVGSLVGDYPDNYFYDIEENLPLPAPLDDLPMQIGSASWPALDASPLEALVNNYFAFVHPNHPLIPQHVFDLMQAQMFKSGPLETVETAICYAVYALGSLASRSTGFGFSAAAQRDQNLELSLKLFHPALRVILRKAVWGFRPNVQVCQALVLAGAYFAYLGRPLHSWKMIYYASHKFIFLLEKRKRAGLFSNHDDCYMRLFWCCFMFECETAGELDIPRSGVEPLADQIPLPQTLDPAEDDDMLYFVAETAIRRLLNRIHSSLYSANHPELAVPRDAASLAGPNNFNLNKLITLGQELNRQLEEWYSSIPSRIRPSIGTDAVASERGLVLRLRYYTARHLIYRPFVLYAVLPYQATGSLVSPRTTPPSMTPQQMAGAASGVSSAAPQLPVQLLLDMCNICIASCRLYLLNVIDLLERRTPYIWTSSQNCMACLLVLLLAETCPPLRPLTPDIRPLQAMVVSRLRNYQPRESSLQAEADILESMPLPETP